MAEHPCKFEISRQVYNQDDFDKEYRHSIPPSIDIPFQHQIKESIFDTFSKCDKNSLKTTICTWIPLFDWAPKYKLTNLLPDFMAGFTVAILSIPQAMAYASLANLPEVIGLYTSFFPSLLYAIFGTSQHVSLGMFAVVSLLVGAAQQRLLPNSSSADFTHGMKIEDLPSVQLMVTLTFTVGLVMLVMAVLQLHILASYLSDSLVNGFTTAAAIHVILLQVPPMLQINIQQRSGFFKLIFIVIDIISNVYHTNIAVLTLSLVCIVILYCGKTFMNPQVKKLCPLPVPLESLIVIFTTLISYLYHFDTKYGMKLVDHIPTGFPTPMLPKFSQIPELLPNAIVIAIVIYAVTFSIGKLFGRKNKYRVDPRQELRSLSVCQILPCFFLCHPSSVNLSRATIVEQAGAKTQVTNVVSSAIMLVVMLWAGPLLEPLPMTIWVFSFFVTVLWDVSEGLVVSIAFALFTIIIRIQWADTKRIAKIGNTEMYKDVEAHPIHHCHPEILLFYFNSPLLYVNSDRFKENAMKLISDANSSHLKPKYLILDASAITFCDKTGALTIAELAEELLQENVTMLVASSSSQLREICENCNVYKAILSSLFYPTVHDAVLFVTQKQPLNFVEIRHM